MARIVVVAATLGDVIQRTNIRPDLRWSVPSDNDALISLGFNSSRLDGSLHIAVAEDEGKIVGYCGFMLKNEIKDSDWLVVKTNPREDIIAVEGFVADTHRGRRLLPNMEGMAARHYGKMGYRRLIGLIGAENMASIKAHAHIGAHPLKKLRRLRIGNLMLVWQNGVVCHFSRRPNTPYILNL